MKKEYLNAELEILWFDSDDTITTSGGGVDPQTDNYKTYDIDDLPIAP